MQFPSRSRLQLPDLAVASFFLFAAYSLLYMTMLVGERRVFTSIRPNLFVASPQQWRRSWWVSRKLVTK